MPSPAAQGVIERFLSRLQRPLLFKLALGMFLLDFVLPDPIPFLDEILFGIVTLLLSKQKAIDTTVSSPETTPPPQESGR